MSNLAIENKDVVINIPELNQPIQLSVKLPQQFIIKNIHGIDAASEAILELLPQVRKVATEAFIDKNSQSWGTIQTLLYYLNYKDLLRIERMHDETPLVEYALRKEIYNIWYAHTPSYKLDCLSDFNTQSAVEELALKASSHRINHHPLLQMMAEQGLNLKSVKKFLENYYVNNRLFHLFIAALSFCTPLERRTELACNFFDEMGAGDSAMAHPLLFLKNFDTIGKPDVIFPNPESLELVNAKTYAAFLSGDYHYGMGGFGFIELTMPDQMRKILTGLGKSGLPRADLEFWEIHITIDEEHGKTWFAEMLHLIKTPEHAQKCLLGGMRLLDARADMYDGVLNAITNY
ncbi:MAG: iron-containing redox enzyme family protein [Legionella sp.]|nr:iron-containing redox enzyme family protein [Legionella sp.]